MSRALVWFKRDLRVADHAPLLEAARCESALGLFILEPAWLTSPECHPRHVAWLLQSLASLRESLAGRGLPLLVCTGEAVDVLARLRRGYQVTHLFSHEETGPGWSYERDKAVGRWCHTEGVAWTELPQTGVVRRLKDRRGWAGRWQARMDAPVVETPSGWRAPEGWSPGNDAQARAALAALPAWLPPGAAHAVPASLSHLPTLADLGLSINADLRGALPVAGEAAAHDTLASFLAGRGRGYRRHLSSPLSAEDGCSRLSAHLAFGTISMRTVHQATEAAIRTTPDRGLAHDLRGFAGRLRWHCHFMQKLEDEPAIEWRNFSRSADGLRPGDGSELTSADQERLQAWREGRTGFPMVDACMRQLRATGWLNFRMRAMLVSVAAYHLWLHWREPGLHLARQFLDFEPGIHWSQMQMQSGTTGINTLRIYSPSKQALDHDPQGLYIRRWVPEYGTPAYPAPIVDEKAAVKAAKDRLYGLRKTPQAQQEASRIQARHGSRKSGLPQTTGKRRAARTAHAATAEQADRQGSLF